MSLQVRGASAAYGATEVLRDVDLTVPSGHVVALLGPNGAGKTTLLRMCSGLLPATRGAVVLDGLGHSGPDEDGDPRRVSGALGAFFAD